MTTEEEWSKEYVITTVSRHSILNETMLSQEQVAQITEDQMLDIADMMASLFEEGNGTTYVNTLVDAVNFILFEDHPDKVTTRRDWTKEEPEKIYVTTFTHK